ncbi:hypothetical protein [Rhodopila sp.]|uniref:hypothetical protein n=1 Tax=Rhodopila sp. TaxID=2480087 RepID=UPI003D110187
MLRSAFHRARNLRPARSLLAARSFRGAWACVWLCGIVLATATNEFAQGGGALSSGSPALQAIRARGALLCGTGREIPGFSMIDSGGVRRGIDADYCRAVAAATLDDAWAARIVRQVGNDGELWKHDITPLGLDRGRNAAWTKGGLQFAPQFR